MLRIVAKVQKVSSANSRNRPVVVGSLLAHALNFRPGVRRINIDIQYGKPETGTVRPRLPVVLRGLALLFLLVGSFAAAQTVTFTGNQLPASIWDELAPEVVVELLGVPAGHTVHAVFVHGRDVLLEHDLSPSEDATDVRIAFAAVQVTTLMCDRTPYVGLVANRQVSGGAAGATDAFSEGNCLRAEDSGPSTLLQLPIAWSRQGQYDLHPGRWLPVMALEAQAGGGSSEFSDRLVATFVAVTIDGARPELPSPVSIAALSELLDRALVR